MCFLTSTNIFISLRIFLRTGISNSTGNICRPTKSGNRGIPSVSHLLSNVNLVALVSSLMPTTDNTAPDTIRMALTYHLLSAVNVIITHATISIRNKTSALAKYGKYFTANKDSSIIETPINPPMALPNTVVLTVWSIRPFSTR